MVFLSFITYCIHFKFDVCYFLHYTYLYLYKTSKVSVNLPVYIDWDSVKYMREVYNYYCVGFGDNKEY